MQTVGAETTILDWQSGAVLLALFSVVWVLLGWYLGRNNKTATDFMLAGRRVGLALATATAMATWVTSNTTMVAPQLAYQLGIWGIIGYSLGSIGLILFAPLAARIRELMPGGFTSGDFMRMRYGKTSWRIFLGISFFYAFGWLVSLAMAGGVLIHALTGIDYRIGMSVILWVCVAYTMLGGLRAVIGTDFVQTIILLSGIALLGFLVLQRIGVAEMHEVLLDERPQLLNLLMPAAILFLFNNLFFGIGEIFHSNVWWSRAFAFGKGVGFRAYLLAGLFWIPVPIAAGFVALAAPALGINVPAADMVGPLVASHLLGYTGAILICIVIFSALASSLDSVLAATSDLIVKDIWKGHFRPAAGEESLRRAVAVVTLLLGLATWLVALPRIATLGALLHFTGAFVAAAIWPVLFGLIWQRTSALAAASGMVVGSIAGLIGYFTIGFYTAALFAAAASLLATLGGSYLRPADFRWEQLSEADVGDTPPSANKRSEEVSR